MYLYGTMVIVKQRDRSKEIKAWLVVSMLSVPRVAEAHCGAGVCCVAIGDGLRLFPSNG